MKRRKTMKKLIVLLLALLLVASMTACGEDAPATQPAAVITKATTPAADPTEPAATEPAAPAIPTAYIFEADGVQLPMGQPFDGTQISAANNVVELPSCAIDGVDIIYTYDNYEITASDEGEGAYLTAILLLNEGQTPEGVKIGDEESKITATYGDDCEADGVQYTYEADGAQLIFMVEGGVIVTIEYRLAM